MKFADLFAGLGGFHIALSKLGHDCVFASEKKEHLAKLYERNYDIPVNLDISKIAPEDVPAHDILCAGFPCQPFSKAGHQLGLKDETNGNLFDVMAKIIDYHKPKYILLENVRNLEKHDGGNTWDYIQYTLREVLEYDVDMDILSPHQFGIPQHRQRCFIVGARKDQGGLFNFEWPEKNRKKLDLDHFVQNKFSDRVKLEPNKSYVLDLWQEFLDRLPKSAKLPSWPIWGMEFGADYPFEDLTPSATQLKQVVGTKGSFGKVLEGRSFEDFKDDLPSYARYDDMTFPTWKKTFIRQNRAFFEVYRKQLAPVMKKIQALEIPSHQKFEWNVQGGERQVRNYLIQFRASGVRLKRSDYFPSLVCNRTQVPIIGWQERYITPEEGGDRIQSMEGIELPETLAQAFSALGNAVNVSVVRAIAEQLVIQNESSGVTSHKARIKSTLF